MHNLEKRHSLLGIFYVFCLGCPLLTVFPVQKFVIHNGTMTAHYLDICVNNMWRLSKEEPSTTTRTGNF